MTDTILEVAPNVDELNSMIHAISHLVARFMEKRGFLERDADDCKDAGGRATQEQLLRTATWRWNRMTTMRWRNSKDIDVKGFTNAAGAWMRLEWPITYRIAVGPQQGRKVFAYSAYFWHVADVAP
jgi:hypothetical protein